MMLTRQQAQNAYDIFKATLIAAAPLEFEVNVRIAEAIVATIHKQLHRGVRVIDLNGGPGESYANTADFAHCYHLTKQICAHDGFESAMCRMGILIGAMATHETDDGKRAYNNEHIQWMFEQWHRAQ